MSEFTDELEQVQTVFEYIDDHPAIHTHGAEIEIDVEDFTSTTIHIVLTRADFDTPDPSGGDDAN